MKSRGKIARKSRLDVRTSDAKPQALQDVVSNGNLPAIHNTSLQANQALAMSEAERKERAEVLIRTLGTEEKELQVRLLFQAVNSFSDVADRPIATLAHVEAALRGIGPKDALQGMLAVQMVSVHSLAMECMLLAASREQTDVGREVYINRATKLMRAFVSLTEALERYRGKGGQKMTIEHVHVYRGGQAIVGQVRQNQLREKTDGLNGGRGRVKEEECD